MNLSFENATQLSDLTFTAVAGGTNVSFDGTTVFVNGLDQLTLETDANFGF